MSQSPQISPQNATPPSLADLVAPESEPSGGIGSEAWIKIAVIGALLVAMNFWQSPILYNTWTRPDGNWTHCFVIPLFSLYLLYSRRVELLAAGRKTCWWGLPVIILGMLGQALSVYPFRNHWIYQLNMIVVVFGLVLLIAGTKVIRVTWLPILFLWLAMPIPDGWYNSIAYPLQELAARGSTGALSLFGVEITRAGSTMDITSLNGNLHQLQVVEACSGVRSLMAFLALGVAMAYLEDRANWQRVLYVASAIPIAILCNILRVTITAEMFVLDKPAMGSDFMHEFTGILMLIPAFIMLWLVGKVLQSIYVEEDDDQSVAPVAASTTGPDSPASSSPQEAAK